MSIIGWLATSIFVGGYVLIAFEQKLGLHKSAVAILMGCLLWFMAALVLWNKPDILEGYFTGIAVHHLTLTPRCLLVV